MTDFFQVWAVNLALALGLIQPLPEFQIHQGFSRQGETIRLTVTLAGMESAEMINFLATGRSLALVQKTFWGQKSWRQARILHLDLWESEFRITDRSGRILGRSKSRVDAFRSWGDFFPLDLGMGPVRSSLAGTPIRVVFSLEPGDGSRDFDPSSLWGYREPEVFFYPPAFREAAP